MRCFAPAWLLCGLGILGCGGTPGPPPPGTPEQQLRAKLGVPPGAKRVMIVSQSAHLDIDWQKTFDGYYTAFVDTIFSEALDLLASQPRAVYSVAEMAYLKEYVAHHPERLAELKADVARGALRIVGGGITSPDTLLPETEMLLRDYTHGLAFAEDSLGAKVHAAWLPDSFGHSATAPDVLAALGFDAVGFARVDGAPTFYEASVKHVTAVRPGSTAEKLAQLGSADFLWTGPGGGTVLAHWIASGLYCTGDNIDYDEQLQFPGGHLGSYRGDEPAFTDGQIDGYVAALEPYAKTPYLFVPVGCDFQHPKPELISYLDGYNQRRYPETGVFVAPASFEDYAALVRFHAADLPTLSAYDITPYFMGFYGTRAGVKRAVREAARPFFAAETFAVAAGPEGLQAVKDARDAFELLLRSDHHDFVTGTSNDRVASSEQMPLLAAAQKAGEDTFQKVAANIASRIPPVKGSLARAVVFNPAPVFRTEVVEILLGNLAPPFHALVNGQAVPVETVAGEGTLARFVLDLPSLSWQAVDFVAGALPPAPDITVDLLDDSGKPAAGAQVTRVVMRSAKGPVPEVELRRGNGFALTSLKWATAESPTELIRAPSFVIADYQDEGGLWRLGNEMQGCGLTPLAPAPAEPETVTVDVRSPLAAQVSFSTRTTVRTVRIAANPYTAVPHPDPADPGVSFSLTTAAPSGTTRTAQFHLNGVAGARQATSQPGGLVDRTAQHIYSPTFWPAVGSAWFQGIPFRLRQSTGVRFDPARGDVELMVARNAQLEACDIEGGTGTDGEMHTVEWAIGKTEPAWNRPIRSFLVAGPAAATQDLPAAQSLGDVDAGELSSLRPAVRGDGVIARVVLAQAITRLRLRLPGLAGSRVTRVDAAERDREELGLAGESIALDRATFGPIATIRIH